MEKEVTIEVSNRHVHLTKETYEKLFDDQLQIKKYLSVDNNFAAEQTLTIEANGIDIENVRILGPFRNYNQVEISHNDARKLKINPPVRKSGDLENAENIILKTDKASINISGCIIAQRHIHISPEDASSLNLVDGQKINLALGDEKKGIIEVFVKVTKDSPMIVHIDTDDANAFIINSGDIGKIIL